MQHLNCVSGSKEIAFVFPSLSPLVNFPKENFHE